MCYKYFCFFLSVCVVQSGVKHLGKYVAVYKGTETGAKIIPLKLWINRQHG